MALTYLDIVLVLVVAAPALASGAPVLGYIVGGCTWILARLASTVAERRIADVGDVRQRLGFGVAFSMARVWFLAIAIIIAGVAASRADGLTAALVIFGAFSLRFACAWIMHATRKRGAGS